MLAGNSWKLGSWSWFWLKIELKHCCSDPSATFPINWNRRLRVVAMM